MNPHYLSVLLLSAVWLSGCAVIEHKEEIGTLVDLGKDSDRQDKVLAEETSIYESMKKELLNGGLRVGMDAQEVLRRVGEPVMAARTNEQLRWSYKSGDVSWMKGEAVHLYFDQGNQLLKWQCVRFDCPAEE